MSLLRGVSFDHLKKKTRKYTLPGCFVRSDREVVLELQHAGEDNDGWINAWRKLDAEKALATRPTRDYFAAVLPAFAAFVVVGWEHVLDEEGQAVPPSPEGVVELLTAYAEVAFDLACGPIFYAARADNFRDFKPPQVDAESLGKG